MSTVIGYIVAFTLALIATSAQAVFYTGNDMAKFCGTSETAPSHYSDRARCSGYVIGVVDSMTRVEAYADDLCLPRGVTVGQLTNVVEKFMADHPAEMHRPGIEVVGFAMFDAFPCK